MKAVAFCTDQFLIEIETARDLLESPNGDEEEDEDEEGSFCFGRLLNAFMGLSTHFYPVTAQTKVFAEIQSIYMPMYVASLHAAHQL